MHGDSNLKESSIQQILPINGWTPILTDFDSGRQIGGWLQGGRSSLGADDPFVPPAEVAAFEKGDAPRQSGLAIGHTEALMIFFVEIFR